MSVKLVPGSKKKTYKSIAEASRLTGIPYITLWKRVNELKWSINRAIKADVRKYDRRAIMQDESVAA